MTLVLLNRAAGGGRGGARWDRVAPRVRERLGDVQVVEAPSLAEARARVCDALTLGIRTFVAAGGDGTVNRLVGLLADALPDDALATVAVGAVGLGSSNDVHKPHRPGAWIDDVPVRLDAGVAGPHDLGVAELDGTHRVFLLNASVGVTAEANHAFNHPGPVLSSLKRSSTSLAIAYAALRTVLAYRGQVLRLTTANETIFAGRVLNLAAVKSPYISGNLRYGDAWQPDSGRLRLHVLHDAGRLCALATLRGLTRGSFPPGPKRLSLDVDEVTVSSAKPFALELDGEVLRTSRVRLAVTRRFRLCS